jgi:hypothetical protein
VAPGSGNVRHRPPRGWRQRRSAKAPSGRVRLGDDQMEQRLTHGGYESVIRREVYITSRVFRPNRIRPVSVSLIRISFSLAQLGNGPTSAPRRGFRSFAGSAGQAGRAFWRAWSPFSP